MLFPTPEGPQSTIGRVETDADDADADEASTGADILETLVEMERGCMLAGFRREEEMERQGGRESRVALSDSIHASDWARKLVAGVWGSRPSAMRL